MDNYFYFVAGYIVFWAIPFIVCLALVKKLKACESRIESLERSKSS